MAKKSAQKKNGQKGSRKTKSTPDIQQELSGPWISMRTGVRIIALASIFMAVLTAWTVIPERGTLMGILWGLFFGGMIWVIFLVFYLYGRYIRR